MIISDHEGPIDVGEFTQEWQGKPNLPWRVSWDERVLDAEGENDLLGRFPCEIAVDGELRIAFFFYLNLDRALITPAERISLPEQSFCPERLVFMSYDPSG